MIIPEPEPNNLTIMFADDVSQIVLKTKLEEQDSEIEPSS